MDETNKGKTSTEAVQESYRPMARRGYVPCSAQPTGDRPAFTPPQESAGAPPPPKPSSEGTGDGGQAKK
jgi:hypothetical protein